MTPDVRQRLVIGVAVVAIAMAVWLLLGRSGDDPGPVAEGEARTGSHRDPRRAPLTTETPEESAGQGDASSSSPTADADDDEPARHFALLCLRATDGEPVPGARVRYLFPREDVWIEDERRETIYNGADVAILDQYGAVAVAGEDGIARLPFFRQNISLTAAAPGWRTEHDVELDASLFQVGPVTVELHPAREVRVRVTGATGGLLAGFPVALMEVDTSRRSLPKSWGQLDRRLTDENGFVTIPVVARTFEGAGAAIIPGIPMLDPPVLRFDPHAPPAGVQDLRVEALGAIDVVLDGDDLELVHGKAVASLRVVAKQDRGAPGIVRMPVTSSSIEKGKVTFPWVGTGLLWEVEIGGTPIHLEPLRLFAGPTRAGEVVRVRAKPGRRGVRFDVRVVGIDGKPFADSVFLMYLDLESSMAHPQMIHDMPIRTDESGRASFFLESSEVSTDEPMRFSLSTGAHPVSRRPWKATAWKTFELEEVVESVNLGDVVLRASPPAVAGVVVDPAGQPVPHAWVWLDRVEDEIAGSAGSALTFVNAVTTQVTDTRGRFRMYDAHSTARVRLRATAPGFGHAVTPVLRMPDANLRIQLPPGSDVTARFLLPAGIDRRWIHPEIQGASFAGLPEHGRRGSLEGVWAGGNAMRWFGIAAGTFSLRVRENWSGRFLLELDDVEADGATPVDDPRLDPIDLRDIPVTTLMIVDEDGRPLRVNLSQKSIHDVETNADGEARFPTSFSVPQLRIVKRGYRAMTLDGPVTSRTVVLRRGYPVRVRVRGIDPARALPIALGIHPEGRDRGPATEVLLEDGEVTLYVSRPGRYVVTSAPGVFGVTGFMYAPSSNVGLDPTVEVTGQGGSVTLDVKHLQ